MHDVDASHSMYYDASFQSTFDYKSVSGHVAMCGGAAVDWGSHTQSVVATSTCEAEVLATVRGTQQLIHIKTLLEEFDIASPLEPTLSFEGYIKTLLEEFDNAPPRSFAERANAGLLFSAGFYVELVE